MSIISNTSVVMKQAKNMRNISLLTIAEKAVRDNENKIIKAQQDQLRKGIRGDGNKITPDYSAKYAAKKGFKTPNLFDTGEMYGNMGIITGVPNDKEYTLFSDVDYFPKLNKQYEKAFELNKPSEKVPEVNNEILKQYHIEINK